MAPPLPPLPPVDRPVWRQRLDVALVRTGLGARSVAAIVAVVAVVAVVVTVVVLAPHPVTPSAAAPAPAPAAPVHEPDPTTTTGAPLVIDVVGAVIHPGLLRLAPGSRVADAIAAAGGVSADADLAQVNQARTLADGEQVRVPRRGEVLPTTVGPRPGAKAPTVPAQPVDLNAATAAELDALPGVGPSTAAAIVEWRTRHGRFRSVEDLLEVPGIGDAKLDRLRPFVRV